MKQLFVNRSRYRMGKNNTSIEHNTAYIDLTEPHSGIPAGPIAQFYLNDDGKRERNPARVALVERILAMLNTEAPVTIRKYAHTPETCPSKHWNDGTDYCADCGADLQGDDNA